MHGFISFPLTYTLSWCGATGLIIDCLFIFLLLCFQSHLFFCFSCLFRALQEISRLGGNQYLEDIVHKLSLVFKEETQA